MPQMGESVAEGTIVRWMKKVGDPVERDEPLFEISTDKVDAEIPSPIAGVLSEIKVKEGETVADQHASSRSIDENAHSRDTFSASKPSARQRTSRTCRTPCRTSASDPLAPVAPARTCGTCRTVAPAAPSAPNAACRTRRTRRT